MFIYLPRNSANYNPPIITQRATRITNHQANLRTDTPSGWSWNCGRVTSRTLWFVRSPLVTTLNVFRLFWNGKFAALQCSRASAKDKQTVSLRPRMKTRREIAFSSISSWVWQFCVGGIWMLFPCAVYSRSYRVSLTRDTCPHYHLWRSTGNR